MAFLLKIPHSSPLVIKTPDKSPSLSPEINYPIKNPDYIDDNYEEKPDFKLNLQKILSSNENGRGKEQEFLEKELENNSVNHNENSKRNEDHTNEIPASSSQELKIQTENFDNLQTETNLLPDSNQANRLARKTTRYIARHSQLFEHFKKFEKTNRGEEDEKDSPEKRISFKRINRRQKTKFRDHNEYKNLKIFFPDDSFKQRWDILIMLLLVYSITLLPYRIAFNLDDTELTNFDYFIDACFLMDVILNFFSAYYDDEGNLIVNRKLIAKHYFTGWFLIDLPTSIPLTAVFENQARLNNLGKLLRLPRFYSLLRMVKILRVLKAAQTIQGKTHLSKYINRFFNNYGNKERVLLSIFAILIISHCISCIWYLLADLQNDPDNWVSRLGFSDDSQFDLYVASFYWTIQTIVTVGYGDINPFTYAEHIYAIICMFCGVFVYSLTVGSVSATLSRSDKKNKEFNEKMEVLISIQNQYKIGSKLFFKIKNQLKYGKAIEQEFKEFVEDLPANLNMEVSLIMNEEIINSIPFLKNKPSAFISTICKYLTPLKIHKNDYICLEGDPADEIYFIKSGRISIVLPEFKDFETIKINTGFHFGELDILFYHEIRVYTYKAIKNCELLVLNKKHFKNLFFSEFKEIGEDFIKNAKSRKRKTKNIVKDAKIFCEEHFRTLHPEYNEKTMERKLKKRTLLNLTGIRNFGNRKNGGLLLGENFKQKSAQEISRAENNEDTRKKRRSNTLTPELNTSAKKNTQIEGKTFLETKLKIWEKRMESLESSVKKMVKILIEMKAKDMKNTKLFELKKPKITSNSQSQSNEINIIKNKSKDENAKRNMIKAALQKYNLEYSEKTEDF